MDRFDAPKHPEPGCIVTGELEPSSRVSKHVVGADSAPDDVCFNRGDRGPEVPRGASIWGEGHLRDVVSPLHGFHPQTSSERTVRLEVLNEPGDRPAEPLLVGSGELLEVPVETRESLIGRQLGE